MLRAQRHRQGPAWCHSTRVMMAGSQQRGDRRGEVQSIACHQRLSPSPSSRRRIADMSDFMRRYPPATSSRVRPRSEPFGQLRWHCVPVTPSLHRHSSRAVPGLSFVEIRHRRISPARLQTFTLARNGEQVRHLGWGQQAGAEPAIHVSREMTVFVRDACVFRSSARCMPSAPPTRSSRRRRAASSSWQGSPVKMIDGRSRGPDGACRRCRNGAKSLQAVLELSSSRHYAGRGLPLPTASGFQQ